MAKPAHTSNSQTITKNSMKKSKLENAPVLTMHSSVRELKTDRIEEDRLLKKSSICNTNAQNNLDLTPFLKMGNSYD